MDIDNFQETVNEVIDSAIEMLKEDDLYKKHQRQFDQAFEERDLDALLSAQMTLHNMELEVVYLAGYRDCMQYLSYINAKKMSKQF